MPMLSKNWWKVQTLAGMMSRSIVQAVCARKVQIILTDGSRMKQVCEINSWMRGSRIGCEWPMSWKEPGCTRRTLLWSDMKAMNWTSCTKVTGGCPDDASSGKRPCRSLIVICGMGILLQNILIFIKFTISCLIKTLMIANTWIKISSNEMASYSTQEWVFNAFGAPLMHQSAQAVPKLPINCLYNTEGLIHTYWMNGAIWLLCSICCWKTTTLGNPIVCQTAELLKFPDPRFFDRITAEGRTIGHARSTHTQGRLSKFIKVPAWYQFRDRNWELSSLSHHIT